MKKNVLMVDDNQDLLEIVKELFAKTEFNFVIAKDGAEGLFKAQNQKFDIVICDYKMPKLDGESFIHEFRSKLKSDVPIIVYSGNIDLITPKTLQLKNIYKLSKPAQGYELVERVRSLVMPQDPNEPAKILPIRFEAGAIIFREADPTSHCYWIKDGEVEIIKEFSDGSEIVLTSLNKGDFLGSYLPPDERFRTYTARAKTSAQLKEITQAQIEKELEGKPEWFKALMQSAHTQTKSIHKNQKMKKAG